MSDDVDVGTMMENHELNHSRIIVKSASVQISVNSQLGLVFPASPTPGFQNQQKVKVNDKK